MVQEAYELNYPVRMMPGEGKDGSLLSVSEKNIIIETVKTAEDKSGDIIVRLYESKNAYTKCILKFGLGIEAVFVTDMLENNEEQLPIFNKQIQLRMKPFEIKTLRVKTAR